MHLWILFLFVFLFLILLGNIAWNIYHIVPKKSPVYREILHFQYDRNKFCTSNSLALEGLKHCIDQVNSISYGPIEWVNGAKNLYGSIYATTGSIDHTLFLENYWITFSDQNSIVVGAIRWSSLYKNKILDPKDTSRTNVPYVISSVTATTGHFEKFSHGKILFDYRNILRNIYIFGNGYDDKLKDYL